jgi:hypothetical protein
MGLKKRSLSLVGRGKPCTERYRDQELAACGQERRTKKGLGFFGHVTGQASGSCQTVEPPKSRAEAIYMHKKAEAYSHKPTTKK